MDHMINKANIYMEKGGSMSVTLEEKLLLIKFLLCQRLSSVNTYTVL